MSVTRLTCSIRGRIRGGTQHPRTEAATSAPEAHGVLRAGCGGCGQEREFRQPAAGGPTPHAGPGVGSRRSASSRSFTFWILPELVIGKSSTTKTWRGTLKLAMRPRQ